MGNYGLDWIAGAFTLWAIHALGEQKRSGFVLMIVGNACWIALGVLTDLWGMIILNVVFVFMNLRGYSRWKHKELQQAHP